MSPYRYRDESSTGTTVASVLIGAVAGFAVGMFVAQRVGGFGGLTAKFRKRIGDESSEGRYATDDDAHFETEDEIEDEPEDVTAADSADDEVPLLEERVLEAFNNDPILAERAIDIGALGSGIIELAGWVDNDAEAEHAMTIARGVPGVDTVVNRLMIDAEERQIDDNIQRFKVGDPALTDAKWEGQQVGTGKRRQGTSDEPDRHANPKPELEERWLSESEAIRNSAEGIEEISAERRKGRKKTETQPEA
jgi:hypothetical protein